MSSHEMPAQTKTTSEEAKKRRWLAAQRARRRKLEDSDCRTLSVVVTGKTMKRLADLQGAYGTRLANGRLRKRSKGEVVDVLADEDQLCKLGYVSGENEQRQLRAQERQLIVEEGVFLAAVRGLPKTTDDLAVLLDQLMQRVTINYEKYEEPEEYEDSEDSEDSEEAKERREQRRKQALEKRRIYLDL